MENEVFVLEALEDILGSAGLVSIGARSGKDGVTIFQKHHQNIDLVILDLHLPGMNGVEVLKSLREIKPDIKVIISSGYDERDIIRQLGDQPPATILKKPYNAQTLLDRVEDELNRNNDTLHG
ncbi:MAG: response regulator [Anaerolineales bacterium]|nr:response regulator [Anaerolineales bacterium]